jgi:hypothetical protein
LDVRSGRPDLLDEVLVPLAFQNGYRDLLGSQPVGLRDGAEVLRYRRVDVYAPPGPRPYDELAHVHVEHFEHLPAPGRGEGRHRPLLPLGEEPEPLHGFDGEVHLRPADAQHFPDAQDTVPRLQRPNHAPLVEALFAQDRYLARDPHPGESFPKDFRRQRVSLFGLAGPLETRHP